MTPIDIFYTETLDGLSPNTYYLHNDGGVVTSYLTDNNSTPIKITNPSLFEYIIGIDDEWTFVTSQVIVVDTIQDRNDLINTTNTNLLVFVNDTTGDDETDGSASLYIYKKDEDQWYRQFAFESTSVKIGWDDIVGRPESSPNEIDDAVNKAHEHPNRQYLDKIDEDQEGNLRYAGRHVDVVWSKIEW